METLLQDRPSDKLVVLVSRDVKNAFNTPAWDLILSEFYGKVVLRPMLHIINSYLEDCFVILDKRTEMAIYAGVPQGSIFEPLLWNPLL